MLNMISPNYTPGDKIAAVKPVPFAEFVRPTAPLIVKRSERPFYGVPFERALFVTTAR